MNEIQYDFTPAIDILTKEYGLITSAIYGRIWRYTQGSYGACVASYSTLAKELGLSAKTISRHVKKLISAELVYDAGYTVHQTRKLIAVRNIEVQINMTLENSEGRTESPMGGDRESEGGVTESPIKREGKRQKEDIVKSKKPKKQTTEEIIADLEKHEEMAKERSGKNPRTKQVMGAMAGGEKQQLDIKSAFAEVFGLSPTWDTKTNQGHYQFFRAQAEKGRHVQQFADWWYKNDWRGKKGQYPKNISQVREIWLQAFMDIPTKTDNDHGVRGLEGV